MMTMSLVFEFYQNGRVIMKGSLQQNKYVLRSTSSRDSILEPYDLKTGAQKIWPYFKHTIRQ